jgi:hypothetical protein
MKFKGTKKRKRKPKKAAKRKSATVGPEKIPLPTAWER